MWVITTHNDKMKMRDSTQTVDYEQSQRKKAEWNVISGGTNGMNFDTDDGAEDALAFWSVFQERLSGGQFNLKPPLLVPSCN